MSLPQIGMLVLSTIASGQANRSMVNRQNDLASQMNAYRMKESGVAQNNINQYLTNLTPDQRTADLNKQQQTLGQQLTDAINASKSYTTAGGAAGQPNADFQGRLQSSTGAADARTQKIADALKVIGAPGQRDLATAPLYNTAATEVDAANGAANRVSDRYMNAIQLQKPDPTWALIGQLAQGAGMVMGAKNFFSPAASSYALDTGTGSGLGLKPSALPSTGYKLMTALR